MKKADKDPLEAVVKDDIKAALEELWPGHWHLMVVPHGYGGNGTFDHVVAAPVEITPEMVGRTYAMFVGIEAKREKVPLKNWTKLQRLNAAQIIKLGGFACCVFGSKNIPVMIANIKKFFFIK